jgi:hypothetical protein
VGFIEDIEDGDDEMFIVIAVLPDRSVSLRFVSDVALLLRRWGAAEQAVPVAVFQAERQSFADAAGIKPVFPQTVDFAWAADKLSKAPIVPQMAQTVLKHLARLDTAEVAGVIAEWHAAAPVEKPRLSYREAAALKEWDDADWRDYLDD